MVLCKVTKDKFKRSMGTATCKYEQLSEAKAAHIKFNAHKMGEDEHEVTLKVKYWVEKKKPVVRAKKI